MQDKALEISNQEPALAERIVSNILSAIKIRSADHERLKEVVEEQLSNTDIGRALRDRAILMENCEDWAFLLPEAKRKEALAVYDVAGEVGVSIMRTLNASSVEITNKINQERAEKNSLPMEVRHPDSDQADASAKENALAHPFVRNVAVMVPTMRNWNSFVAMSIFAQWRAALRLSGGALLWSDNTFWPKKDAVPSVSRNALATWFLATGYEWSYWQDDDVIAPIGNSKWFWERTGCSYPREFTGANALEKLTSGPEKFVSAVVASRNVDRALLNQIGLHPVDESDRQLAERLKKGPFKERRKIGWVGFPCVAVHRDVFLAIQQAFPNLAPKKEGDPWRFFSNDDTASEDVAFCNRANKVGLGPVLDCSLFAAHVGETAFLP